MSQQAKTILTIFFTLAFIIAGLTMYVTYAAATVYTTGFPNTPFDNWTGTNVGCTAYNSDLRFDNTDGIYCELHVSSTYPGTTLQYKGCKIQGYTATARIRLYAEDNTLLETYEPDDEPACSNPSTSDYTFSNASSNYIIIDDPSHTTAGILNELTIDFAAAPTSSEEEPVTPTPTEDTLDSTTTLGILNMSLETAQNIYLGISILVFCATAYLGIWASKKLS